MVGFCRRFLRLFSWQNLGIGANISVNNTAKAASSSVLLQPREHGIVRGAANMAGGLVVVGYASKRHLLIVSSYMVMLRHWLAYMRWLQPAYAVATGRAHVVGRITFPLTLDNIASCVGVRGSDVFCVCKTFAPAHSSLRLGICASHKRLRHHILRGARRLSFVQLYVCMPLLRALIKISSPCAHHTARHKTRTCFVPRTLSGATTHRLYHDAFLWQHRRSAFYYTAYCADARCIKMPTARASSW